MLSRKAVFAVICDPDYKSVDFRYPICELSPIEDGSPAPKGCPTSRCGKYYYWQSGKFIVSDVIELDIPYTEIATEDEVEYINRKINMERIRSQEELEKKLDPLKARLTELLAITYQPHNAE